MSSSIVLEHELLEGLTSISKSQDYAHSYRGISLLSELLKTPDRVNQVYHCRKHLCVVFNDRKSLVVADNVPFWAQPEKMDLVSLLSSLLSDSPNVPQIFTLRYASSILHLQLDQTEPGLEILTVIHENGEISAWEWMSESWKWISAGFGKLQLPARFHPASQTRKVLFVAMTAQRRFYWIERIIENEEALKGLRDDPKCQSTALLSCEFQSRFESPISTALAAWPSVVQGLWLAPHNGFWIRFKTVSNGVGVRMAFFATVTGKLTPFKAPNNVIHYVHHPTTLEMLTLDDEGTISVLRPKSDVNLLHQPLSRIPLSAMIDITSVHLHQHILLINKRHGWSLFDTRSGTPLTSFLWPTSLSDAPRLWSWLSAKDTSFGFWHQEGLWLLKSLSISQYTNILASASSTASLEADKSSQGDSSALSSIQMPISPTMSAAMLSRDWSIPRLEAKYLLDILIDYTGLTYPSMKDTVTFVAACDAIVPHLQSPIVLISILEEAHMSTYACHITRKFIDTCLARHQAGMSVVSQNEVDFRAFQLFTTFNTDTIHLLRKFVEIGSEHGGVRLLDSDIEIEASMDDDIRLREELLALPVADCGKMELSYFYVCMNRCPEVLTSKLLEFGGFGMAELNASSQHIWPCTEVDSFRIAFLPPTHLILPPTLNPILLREEERATHPDFFAALCFLIYQFHPQWLLPFVDCLIEREGFSQGRSMLPRRALASIPPFELKYAYNAASSQISTSQTPHNDTQRSHEQELNELRLLARIGLFVRAHRQSSALYLLLDIYQTTRDEKYWRMILFAIDSKKEENFATATSNTTAPHEETMHYLLKTRTELLTTLLMYCLDPVNRMASTTHFEDIFARFSENLTAMDLTTSLRQEYARIQPRKHISVLVTDENSQMSISTLRSQLVKLGVQ